VVKRELGRLGGGRGNAQRVDMSGELEDYHYIFLIQNGSVYFAGFY
jgi:hypothetical protein